MKLKLKLLNNINAVSANAQLKCKCNLDDKMKLPIMFCDKFICNLFKDNFQLLSDVAKPNIKVTFLLTRKAVIYACITFYFIIVNPVLTLYVFV